VLDEPPHFPRDWFGQGRPLLRHQPHRPLFGNHFVRKPILDSPELVILSQDLSPQDAIEDGVPRLGHQTWVRVGIIQGREGRSREAVQTVQGRLEEMAPPKDGGSAFGSYLFQSLSSPVRLVVVVVVSGSSASFCQA
jgi:hypothetical protein